MFMQRAFARGRGGFKCASLDCRTEVVEWNHVGMLGLKQLGSLLQIRSRIAENCQWIADFCSSFSRPA